MMYNIKYRVLEYTVHLSDNANDIIKSYIQNKGKKPESGGILLGQVKGNDIYIQKITIPNKFDKRGRCFFTRDKDAAQVILDYEVANSRNTITYLGEWHTHPENHPTPSDQDLKMIKEQFASSVLNIPFLFLLIQGIDTVYLSLFDGKKFYITNEF